MNNLVQTIGREVVTSSRTIAEVFEKRHSDVVRAIENKIENLTTQNCEVKAKEFYDLRDFEEDDLINVCLCMK